MFSWTINIVLNLGQTQLQKKNVSDEAVAKTPGKLHFKSCQEKIILRERIFVLLRDQ